MPFSISDLFIDIKNSNSLNNIDSYLINPFIISFLIMVVIILISILYLNENISFFKYCIYTFLSVLIIQLGHDYTIKHVYEKHNENKEKKDALNTLNTSAVSSEEIPI